MRSDRRGRVDHHERTNISQTCQRCRLNACRYFSAPSSTQNCRVARKCTRFFRPIDFDNWDGGTDIWALRLEVPVHIFAPLEASIRDIEKAIDALLTYFNRQYPGDSLREATITPIAAGAAPAGQRMVPSELEVRRLWPAGRFRLFLSHVSNHKITAVTLRDALALRGIHAFVAHEDIEPTLEWQHEIELGLRSMHALAALLTPDFHASKWTDQEVGWALGRGVPVVPLRAGFDPYGLVGKIQGVPGKIGQPRKFAARIAETLLANPHTCEEMRRAAVIAFQESNSGDMAKALCQLLTRIKDATKEEKAIIWEACAKNLQVKGADGVLSSIYSAFGTPPTPKPLPSADDIPF
jgi:TIR domain